MKLIERYVEEVGNSLPEPMRFDIEKEIRSLIQDRLADRCDEIGVPEPDEKMIKDVLGELGPPETVAAGYLPERYLVGPKNFPIFIRVLKFVLVGFAIAMVVSFLVQFFMPGGVTDSLPVLVLKLAAGYLQAAVQIFGSIVLVFALVEWGQRKADMRLKLWTPQSLEEPAPRPVSRGGKIWDALFSLVFLILFNLYPEWVGINLFRDGTWLNIPLLTQAFYQYLPVINIQMGLSLALGIYLAARGYRETISEWIEVAVKLFGMVAAYLLIATGPLLGADANALMQTGWEINAVLAIQNQVIPILNIQLKLALAAVMVINGWQIIKIALRKVRGGVPVIEIKR